MGEANLNIPQITVLLGNIGSGKTTIACEISNMLHETSAVYEPVDEWKEAGILKRLYEDIHTMAFPMQMYAFSSRLRRLNSVIKNDNPPHIVMDGHVIADRTVFKELLREHGHISEAQNDIYEATFKDWETLLPKHKTVLYIYLKTSPSVCFERKKTRGREEEEKGITLEYLEELDDKFESLYRDMLIRGEPIIKVDANNTTIQVTKDCVLEMFKNDMLPAIEFK